MFNFANSETEGLNMMVSSSAGKELAGKEISVSANINISQTRQMMHFEIVDPGQQVQPHFPRIDG